MDLSKQEVKFKSYSILVTSSERKERLIQLRMNVSSSACYNDNEQISVQMGLILEDEINNRCRAFQHIYENSKGVKGGTVKTCKN